jgi:cysteine synthase
MTVVPGDRLLLDSLIGNTPLAGVRARVGGREHLLLLKLEGFNAGGGSIKARTVRGLLDRAAAEGLLHPGLTLVESSSGNLGAALAIQGRARGLEVVIVADPKTTPGNLAKIGLAGAQVEMVKTPDDSDGFLEARLERVQALLTEIPGALWLDQYHSPSNPEIHFHTTGLEIVAAVPEADAVFVACSTGGTAAGIGARVRAAGIGAEVIPVDVPGSHALCDGCGARFLTGIGASRPSSFLGAEERGRALIVPDLEAIAACRALEAEAGVSVGGSSGAAFVGALQWLQDRPAGQTVVVLCADGGDNYDFSDDALAGHGVERLPSLAPLLEGLDPAAALAADPVPTELPNKKESQCPAQPPPARSSSSSARPSNRGARSTLRRMRCSAWHRWLKGMTSPRRSR